jgi:hypothetical protein
MFARYHVLLCFVWSSVECSSDLFQIISPLSEYADSKLSMQAGNRYQKKALGADALLDTRTSEHKPLSFNPDGAFF